MIFQYHHGIKNLNDRFIRAMLHIITNIISSFSMFIIPSFLPFDAVTTFRPSFKNPRTEEGIYKRKKIELKTCLFHWSSSCYLSFFLGRDLVFFLFFSWSKACFLSLFLGSYFYLGRKRFFFILLLKIFL